MLHAFSASPANTKINQQKLPYLEKKPTTVTAKVHKVLINDDAMKSPKSQQLPSYLDSSKCVSIILTGYQCHFLIDPCFLFLNICYKLLVLQRLLQTLPPAWVKKGKISCSVTLQLLDIKYLETIQKQLKT